MTEKINSGKVVLVGGGHRIVDGVIQYVVDTEIEMTINKCEACGATPSLFQGEDDWWRILCSCGRANKNPDVVNLIKSWNIWNPEPWNPEGEGGDG